MTAWPSVPGFSTGNTDAGTDNPSVARVDIKNTMDRVVEMIGARGAASGVAPLDAGSKIPAANLPTGAGGVPILNASGVLPANVVPRAGVVPQVWVQTVPGTHTFTVPDNVTYLYIEGWGGGGGGAWSSTYEHGGGGGASGGAIAYLPVQAGDEVTVVVGAGGGGGSNVGSDADGADGENTTVTLVRTSQSMVCAGGKGGKAVSSKVGGDSGFASGYYHARFRGGIGQTGILTGTPNFGMGGQGGSNARSGTNVYEGDDANVGFGGGGYGSGLGGPTAKPGSSGGVIIIF